MTLVYFILGFIAAVLGALPIGASNIAVMNTTLKQSSHQALKIIIAAGVAEVILSLYALHCTTVVQNFVNKNMWIQFIIATVLLAVGTYLLLKNKKENSEKKPRRKISKYLVGFVLGLLNPPVLIYWIIAIGFINMKNFNLAMDSSLSIIVLFFSGIYLGKIVTLYAYSKFSNFIKSRSQNITLVLNKVTGILLISIGLFQALKLYFI